MATIREWLNDAGFDWENGTIVYQKTDDEDEYPGWDDPVSAEIISHDHPILNQEFGSGYGGPQCPRFFAKDNLRIYFPSQYDGSTRIESVEIDPNYYLDIDHPTPYPGG